MTNEEHAQPLQPEMLDDLIETFATAGLGHHNLMRVELPRHQWAQLAVALSRLHNQAAALTAAQPVALSHALAQLRHLYHNMIEGTVRDAGEAKTIAAGVLGPVIVALETAATPAQPVAQQGAALPEQIADETVKAWQAADKMPPMAFDFRGLIADGIRRAQPDTEPRGCEIFSHGEWCDYPLHRYEEAKASGHQVRLLYALRTQQPAPAAAPTQDMISAVLRLVDLEQGDVEDHRYDDGSKLAEQICRAVLAFVHQPSPTPQADSTPSSPNRPSSAWYRQKIQETLDDDFQIGPAPQADSQPAPIDMVLHCPACGLQHIDGPESEPDKFSMEDPPPPLWDNPPHRSHLCHDCGHIWRPADVPTNGVVAVKTTGKADSPIAAHATADSGAVPAGGVVGPTRQQVSDRLSFLEGLVAEHTYTRIVDEVDAMLTPTPPPQAADSVLEDADLLDFIEQHPEMSLRHRKGKWAFIGFTNYEYEMLPSLRDAIRAARKQGANHE